MSSRPSSIVVCTEEEAKQLQQNYRWMEVELNEFIVRAIPKNVMIGSCVYRTNRWSYIVEMGVQIDIESVSNKAIKIDNKKWSKKQRKYRLWMSFDCLFSPADQFSIIYLHESEGQCSLLWIFIEQFIFESYIPLLIFIPYSSLT